jgi:hypothetical protein
MNIDETLGASRPAVEVPTWAWMVVLLALVAAYALTLENGLVLKAGATTLHEFFHDGRHFLGVPCH